MRATELVGMAGRLLRRLRRGALFSSKRWTGGSSSLVRQLCTSPLPPSLRSGASSRPAAPSWGRAPRRRVLRRCRGCCAAPTIRIEKTGLDRDRERERERHLSFAREGGRSAVSRRAGEFSVKAPGRVEARPLSGFPAGPARVRGAFRRLFELGLDQEGSATPRRCCRAAATTLRDDAVARFPLSARMCRARAPSNT